MCSVKVDEANLVSFLNWTPYIWLLIGNTVTLIRWVSDVWWISCRLDEIWVWHLDKSQITPTILQNEEWGPLSYDTLNCCTRGGAN